MLQSVYHMYKCSKFIHNCTCISHPLHQSKLSLTYTEKVNIKPQFCSLDSITNNKFDSTDKCTCLLQSIYISCKVHGAFPIARWGVFFFNKHVRSSSICVRSTKPDSGKPDRSELDHVDPKQGLCCPICETWDSEMLRSNKISGQPISPSFKGQEIQKTEQSMTPVNRHNSLLCEFICCLIS
jgi:hypothetical protein